MNGNRFAVYSPDGDWLSKYKGINASSDKAIAMYADDFDVNDVATTSNTNKTAKLTKGKIISFGRSPKVVLIRTAQAMNGIDAITSNFLSKLFIMNLLSI